MATPTWDFPERFFIYPQGDGERRKKNYPEALGRYCLMCLQSGTLFERFCQYKMCQPSTGPWWGSLHATPPCQGGEWVLPHCSALQMPPAVQLYVRGKLLHTWGMGRENRSCCVARDWCHSAGGAAHISATQHSQAHPTAGHSEEGQALTSPAVTAQGTQGLEHMNPPV